MNNPPPYNLPSLVELARHRAATTPQRAGYTFVDYAGAQPLDHVLTDADLDTKARRIAVWLQSHGSAGDRVMLVYPAGLDYLVAFWGCLYAGMVAVPAYPPLNPRLAARLTAVVQDCGAIAVLTNAALSQEMGALQANSPLTVLSTDLDLSGMEFGWRTPELAPDSLAFLQYTSGSSGTPKGVMVSHGNLLANSLAMARRLEHPPHEKAFSWLPPYHDMGLIGDLIQNFCAGVDLSFMAPAAFLRKPVRWLQEISRRGATISGAPNFAYELCLDKVPDETLAELDLSRWQVAYSGAEPVRSVTLHRFAERFAPCGFKAEAFWPCYGMAETTLIVSGNQRGRPYVEATLKGDTRHFVSCGASADDHVVVVVDPDTKQAVPDGTPAEIWVAGPSITQGYWCRPEQTKECFGLSLPGHEEAFFRTGDVGVLVDGELFICGRLKDVIIKRGANHYPHDIEATMDGAHEAVRAGCGMAIAVDDGESERLVLLQEIGARDVTRGEEICAALFDAVLRDHGIAPDEVVLIGNGTVPKTTSGKLARAVGQKAYREGTLTVLFVQQRAGNLAELAS